MFYLNPFQRFVVNNLWDLIKERNESILAKRTVSGGSVYHLRDVPGTAWKEWLQKKVVEVAQFFEKSATNSWTEFCIRFAFSFLLVDQLFDQRVGWRI